MTQDKCERTLSLLTGVLDYESFKDVDLVIEVRPNFKLYFLFFQLLIYM